MTVENGGTTSGLLVFIWDCHPGWGSQIWRARANGELVNLHSALCLDDPAAGGWGTQLDIATCTDAADQQWKVPG